ncbi:hypothetical protein G210_5040, partial [Candida maltosa Xu316]
TFPGQGSEYVTSWTTTDSNGDEITQSGLVTANDSTTSTLSTFSGEGSEYITSWTTTDGN